MFFQPAGRLSIQFSIEEDDVLIVAVFHQESLGNPAQLREAQALIKVQGMDVSSHDRIELHDAETQSCAHGQRILDELLADVLPSSVRPDGIAGIADVAASAHVIGVQDVETDNLARLAIHGDTGMGLAAEKNVGLLIGQFLNLWEGNALTHHLVPDRHGLGCVVLLIFSDNYHVVKSKL